MGHSYRVGKNSHRKYAVFLVWGKGDGARAVMALRMRGDYWKT